MDTATEATSATTAGALGRAATTLRASARDLRSPAAGRSDEYAADLDVVAAALAPAATPWGPDGTPRDAPRVVWVLTPEEAAGLLDSARRTADEREEDARHGTGAFTAEERDDLYGAAEDLRALVARLTTS